MRVLKLFCVVLTAVIGFVSPAKTVDRDHVCHRINAGQFSQLNIQALTVDHRSPSRLLLVESGRLYGSLWITEHSVSMPDSQATIDWLEHFTDVSNLKHIANVNKSRVHFLHTIRWNNGSNGKTVNTSATVIQDNRTLFILFNDGEGDDVAEYPAKLEHRVISSQYLFFVNAHIRSLPRIVFSELNNFAKDCTQYLALLRDGMLRPPKLTGLCWFESDINVRTQVQIKCRPEMPNMEAQLFHAIPLGFRHHSRLYLVDVNKGQVHSMTVSEKHGNHIQVIAKESRSFRDFFSCYKVGTAPTNPALNPTQPSTDSNLLFIIIGLAFLSITVGLLVGVGLMYWLKHSKTPVAAGPKSKPKDSATLTLRSSQKTNDTKKTGNKWRGQFLLTLEKRPTLSRKKDKAGNKKRLPPAQSSAADPASSSTNSSATVSSYTSPWKKKKSKQSCASSVASSFTFSAIPSSIIATSTTVHARTPSDAPEDISGTQKTLLQRYRELQVPLSTGFHADGSPPPKTPAKE